MDKVMKMCLFHDLGEALTGDIPAFVKTDDDRETEGDALTLLTAMLPGKERQENCSGNWKEKRQWKRRSCMPWIRWRL